MFNYGFLWCFKETKTWLWRNKIETILILLMLEKIPEDTMVANETNNRSSNEFSHETQIAGLKLSYFEHTMWRPHSTENSAMLENGKE